MSAELRTAIVVDVIPLLRKKILEQYDRLSHKPPTQATCGCKLLRIAARRLNDLDKIANYINAK